MQQWNEALLRQCAEQWKQAMNSTENFSAEIRPKDAVDRQQDESVESFDAAMGSSCERVGKTLECLSARGYGAAELTVLDIGSGTGTYTLPFARHYRAVTSLDISEAMQAVLRRKAAEQDVENIAYLHANWRELDLREAGLVEAFDLVMCNVNPRGVCDLETLKKMNDASRAGCCLSTFAGRGRSNHGADLQRLILGRTLGTTGGNNIIFPFNAVYHLGGEPELSYATIRWERRMEAEAAVEGICRSYWRFAEIDAPLRGKIADYVYANLEDGQYVDRTENLIGIMVWDAWRIKEQGN